MTSAALLPRAPLRHVLTGRSPLVGSRLDPARPRGFASPIEARVALGLPYGDLADEEAARLDSATPSARLAALASALLASTLHSGREAPARPHIVAARVDNLRIDEALDALFAPPPTDRARVVHFVHPHALNLACVDEELRAHLARADLVLPDGVGLRLAALILGLGLRDNLNGTDLLPLICRRAAASGRPLVLIGAAPGVAHDAAERLRRDFPGLSIPLVAHGFLGPAEVEALTAQLDQLTDPLVLVAMGSPRQEAWIWRHLASRPRLTALSVGGLLDFVAGRVPRAPWLWRELGLEWLFRLRQEPARLARRYLVGNPLFVLRALRQRLCSDAGAGMSGLSIQYTACRPRPPRAR